MKGKIETLKPADLVSRVNDWITLKSADSHGDVFTNKFLLQEEIWGYENGLYVPIGMLNLPVTLVYDDVFEQVTTKHLITLWSQFAGGNSENLPALSRRYLGPDKESEEHLLRERVWWPSEENPECLVTWGGSEHKEGSTMFDTLMRRHIPNFLKLYEKTRGKPGNLEYIQRVRKAFTDYRCLSEHSINKFYGGKTK